jgi:hypothetical protein
MAIKKAIDKLHEVIGGNKGSFSDNSGSWVHIENDNFSISFSFDGTGKKFERILITQKVWQVVDEKTVTEFKQ